MKRVYNIVLMIFCFPILAGAAMLPQASVTKAQGDVHVSADAKSKPRPAKTGEVIADKNILGTGNQSRAELEFEDATITRLGSHTIFTFDRGARALNLQEGSVLVQVFDEDGQCKVVTSAVTAGIEGTTALVEAGKGGEGRVYLFESSKKEGISIHVHATGQKLRIQPGQFLDIPAKILGQLNAQNFDVRKMWKEKEVGESMGSLREGADGIFLGEDDHSEKFRNKQMLENIARDTARQHQRDAVQQTTTSSQSPPPSGHYSVGH
ncbi:MAG: FecR domain-containing protein [Verrucomicrobiota bacterium]